MSTDVMYERDLLYTAGNLSDPGSIHVVVLNPTKNGRLPVVIDQETTHSPLENISSIIRVMQSDIFDRILIDIKAKGDIYIKNSQQSSQNEFENKKYVMVRFENDKICFCGVDMIDGD